VHKILHSYSTEDATSKYKFNPLVLEQHTGRIPKHIDIIIKIYFVYTMLKINETGKFKSVPQLIIFQMSYSGWSYLF
jgi:hypothetical protein